MQRCLLLGALAGMLVLTASFRAQGQDCRQQDAQVRRILCATVGAGAPAFNRGDWNGCYRIYQGSLASVMPLLDHRPSLRATLARARHEAAQMPSDFDKAWRLRRAIDLALEAL